MRPPTVRTLRGDRFRLRFDGRSYDLTRRELGTLADTCTRALMYGASVEDEGDCPHCGRTMLAGAGHEPGSTSCLESAGAAA